MRNSHDFVVYGSIIEDRQFKSQDYKYGFNGQEKDDDISGVDGANTTADFWEYDSRTGRRWNLDPKPIAGISDYSSFVGNPIMHEDHNGDYVWGTFSGLLRYYSYKNYLKGLQVMTRTLLSLNILNATKFALLFQYQQKLNALQGKLSDLENSPVVYYFRTKTWRGVQYQQTEGSQSEKPGEIRFAQGSIFSSGLATSGFMRFINKHIFGNKLPIQGQVDVFINSDYKSGVDGAEAYSVSLAHSYETHDFSFYKNPGDYHSDAEGSQSDFSDYTGAVSDLEDSKINPASQSFAAKMLWSQVANVTARAQRARGSEEISNAVSLDTPTSPTDKDAPRPATWRSNYFYKAGEAEVNDNEIFYDRSNGNNELHYSRNSKKSMKARSR